MPQMPVRKAGRKAKRATMLTKRMQYLKKHYKERSYRPMYEKLKNNNNYLAKALSQEKQTCQSLFSQNIALIAEVQDLRLACNTRDNIISNILNNTKEIFRMLVAASGYATNSISVCQEFAASDTNLRLSPVSIGRKESSRRLSTKSPAKGVVKPMVSGHTITKPTINLSRVNMQNFNNPSRLSDIQEVSASEIADRSQEINESRSPIAVSIPITQLRYENRHACRMPERLVVSSPTNNADNKRMVRKAGCHTKKISGSYSRSRSKRWSNEAARSSTGHVLNQLDNPRVKLNDVSKLLQNSQSINIKTLLNNRVYNIESHEISDDASHGTTDRNIIISESQMSVNVNEEDEIYTQTPKKNSNAQINEKISHKNVNSSLNVSNNSKVSRSSNANLEDPLEGPSWLFNDTLTMPSRSNERGSDRFNVSDVNVSASHSSSTAYNDESSDMDDTEEELSPLLNLTKRITNVQIQERDHHVTNIGDSSLDDDDANDGPCAVLPTVLTSNRESHFHNEENDDTTNFASFVTMRRGIHSEIEETEETEDFTLLLSRQPMQNIHFNINELRLPNLEEPAINPTIANEISTEIIPHTIQRIGEDTNAEMLSISNRSANESSFEPNSTVKLSLISANDHDRALISEKTKQLNKRNKKTGTLNSKGNVNNESDVMVKRKAKQKMKSKNSRDPSAAKVVLEKLNESRIKVRTPSPDDTRSQSNDYVRNISVSDQEESYLDIIQDSESNNDNYSSNRPKRRKAPRNLKEPSLSKKLRRNW